MKKNHIITASILGLTLALSACTGGAGEVETPTTPGVSAPAPATEAPTEVPSEKPVEKPTQTPDAERDFGNRWGVDVSGVDLGDVETLVGKEAAATLVNDALAILHAGYNENTALHLARENDDEGFFIVEAFAADYLTPEYGREFMKQAKDGGLSGIDYLIPNVDKDGKIASVDGEDYYATSEPFICVMTSTPTAWVSEKEGRDDVAAVTADVRCDIAAEGGATVVAARKITLTLTPGADQWIARGAYMTTTSFNVVKGA